MQLATRPKIGRFPESGDDLATVPSGRNFNQYQSLFLGSAPFARYITLIASGLSASAPYSSRTRIAPCANLCRSLSATSLRYVLPADPCGSVIESGEIVSAVAH